MKAEAQSRCSNGWFHRDQVYPRLASTVIATDAVKLLIEQKQN